jgi:hypothetical protein
MTSRERVMGAFEHRETDRVPAWCGASPEFWDKAKRALALDDEGLRKRLGDDFRRVYARYRDPTWISRRARHGGAPSAWSARA